MRILTLVVFAVTLAVASAMAANIVADPGFENGTFAPWVANGASNHPWEVSTGAAFAGAQYAATGCVGASCIAADPNAAGAWLYQDLTTVASSVYSLSFYYFSEEGTSDLQVLWGPAGGALSVVSDLVNLNTTSYNLYTINGLTATTGSSRLEFLGRQDPSFDGVDNVCVDLAASGTCAAPVGVGVPEPATLLLCGGGLVALGFLRRRRANSRPSLA